MINVGCGQKIRRMKDLAYKETVVSWLRGSEKDLVPNKLVTVKFPPLRDSEAADVLHICHSSERMKKGKHQLSYLSIDGNFSFINLFDTKLSDNIE